MLVFNKAGGIWAAFYTREEGRVSTRWYGTDDYSVLPAEIRNEFSMNHSNKDN